MTYLSEEPEDFEWPEAGERVEKQRVRVRDPVALKEAHFCCNSINLFLLIDRLSD